MISWRKVRRMQSNQSKFEKKRNEIQAHTHVAPFLISSPEIPANGRSISEQLEDDCAFAFTRWNGGGTPMRQNTDFMYVSSEHIQCAPAWGSLKHWTFLTYSNYLKLKKYKILHRVTLVIYVKANKSKSRSSIFSSMWGEVQCWWRSLSLPTQHFNSAFACSRVFG